MCIRDSSSLLYPHILSRSPHVRAWTCSMLIKILYCNLAFGRLAWWAARGLITPSSFTFREEALLRAGNVSKVTEGSPLSCFQMAASATLVSEFSHYIRYVVPLTRLCLVTLTVPINFAEFDLGQPSLLLPTLVFRGGGVCCNHSSPAECNNPRIVPCPTHWRHALPFTNPIACFVKSSQYPIKRGELSGPSPDFRQVWELSLIHI